ncbi:RdgB/HAM1 family non-canonical purine NTP pyrophosphatase [Pontimonas sp.]|jgi:XTP/dITP diphosphohydrolase|uniref:RdgB/HAM1 family non-canonical purine NTP pyrophosphatase n=1 Tax=Pontimonas sp. TaxID=2304492 RepID=UPI00286FE2BD|nr:RdgB/HAM1 family non-canonical purine NTP pyrophosphatase [Pontimonas sp.]MDR9397028.1 RdgB/HAM1 family non-canonical purine NTP pyrophosphatase [Pontimonas sp.]MDR9434259.1 RdgB/HAM1 family non-canonical purine NTP pyrophosphatase [Pontimonas sp.]
MQLVFASHNAHKRDEVHTLMAEVWPSVDITGPHGDAPVEYGDAFVDNALIKARVGFADSGQPTIADDSGICADALDGAPGIHSARYSPSGDDADNVSLLLENMEGVSDRRAYFVCVAALVDADGELTIERRWYGTIAEAPRGAGGFGYDPVFIPDGQDHTAAEMTVSDKNRVSHRGQAFQALAGALIERYQGV